MNPDLRKGGGAGGSRWIPAVLVLAAAVILIGDAVVRRRDTREGDLSYLRASSRERALALEGTLLRLDREFGLFGGLAGAGEMEMGQGLIAGLMEHLSDLGEGVSGIALLGPSGVILEATPPSAQADVRALDIQGATRAPELRSGTVLEAGMLSSGGQPTAGLTRRIRGQDGETLGFLIGALSLENLPGNTGSSALPGTDLTLILLDSLGQVLSHPNRDWVGWPILADGDSLYDPEFFGVLPEILSGSGGSWRIVSEVISEGSWSRGRASLLAFAPVRLPEGGAWHLGLALMPEATILPGVPKKVRVDVLALFFCLGLAALFFFLPKDRALAARMEAAGRQGEWYRTLLESEADGVLVLDRDHRVVVANDAFRRLMGGGAADLEGVPSARMLDFPARKKGLGASMEIPPGISEGRLKNRDGPPLEVELNTGRFSMEGEEFSLSVVRDVTWRRQVEKETLRVGERERLLLGKELHDGLGQHLTGVAFMAKTLARKLADRGGEEADEADRLGQLVKDAVGQIRILSRGLELSEYSGTELPAALEEMSGVVRRLMGVALEVELEPSLVSGEGGLDSVQATQVYRLCHDVVSDSVRNRLARNVWVNLHRDGDRVILSIHQDGEHHRKDYLEGSETPSYRLRYRARLLDAVLDVMDHPEGGTVTTCAFQLGRERG